MLKIKKKKIDKYLLKVIDILNKDINTVTFNNIEIDITWDIKNSHVYNFNDGIINVGDWEFKYNSNIEMTKYIISYSDTGDFKMKTITYIDDGYNVNRISLYVE